MGNNHIQFIPIKPSEIPYRQKYIRDFQKKEGVHTPNHPSHPNDEPTMVTKGSWPHGDSGAAASAEALAPAHAESAHLLQVDQDGHHLGICGVDIPRVMPFMSLGI